MTVEETKRFGFVHLQMTKSGLAFIRFSKPLLRLLLAARKNAMPFGDAQDHLAMSLPLLLKTCRDYHGDVEEAVHLLSLATARAAYVLLTPGSRPGLASLEGLRPGAQAFGTKDQLKELETMAETLKKEADAVDKATVGRRARWERTKNDVVVSRNVVEKTRSESTVRALEQALVDHTKASSAYVKARLDVYKMTDAYALRCRGQPLSYTVDSKGRKKIVRRKTDGGASLTQAKCPGVDAWMYFGDKVYAMQCKGQETGAGAGQAGGDSTFAASDMSQVLKQFTVWLTTKGADDENVAALELFTTKRMTPVTKATKDGRTRAVVVVARDVLLSSLGLIWGGIAARCMDARAPK